MAKDIIGLITKVEDDGYGDKTWKLVTLGTGEVLKVKYGKGGALKDKWSLLGVGVAIHFKMKDFMKQGEAFPFVEDIEVTDISTVASELPPAVEVKTVEVPPELTHVRATEPTPRTIAPQERGMWWKQLGDDLRTPGRYDKKGILYRTLDLRYHAEMFSVLAIEIKQNLEEAEEDKE
ncbi:hypothetical protein LCGC14_0988610 [marine sediment metagenome]|uniref:Uncharacterized protein n=1 Tax=marine sediment metagenome TaxID=412755 RepID=A0A0F9NT41_9ZZZZ